MRRLPIPNFSVANFLRQILIGYSNILKMQLPNLLVTWFWITTQNYLMKKRELIYISLGEQLKYYSIKNQATFNEIQTDNIQLAISNLKFFNKRNYITHNLILNKFFIKANMHFL